MSTQDNALLAKASELHDFPHKPFLKKSLIYVLDSNGSNDYSRNEVTFESLAVATSGSWTSYDEGWITLPFVCTVQRSALAITGAEAASSLALKNPFAMIQSYSVSYNNDPLIPERQGVDKYSEFKILSEWSQDDVQLHGDFTGFHKHSNNWGYNTQVGIFTEDMKPSLDECMYDGQNGRSNVVGVNHAFDSGFDTVTVAGDTVTYKKIVNLPLKLFLGLEKLPLIKGGTVRIVLRLNQGSMVRSYTNGTAYAAAEGANAEVPFVPRALTQTTALKGSSVPVLITAGERVVGTGAYVETIKWGVGNIASSGNAPVECVMKQCRMYLPTVEMTVEDDLKYIQHAERKHCYEDYHYVLKQNVSNAFDLNLTTGLKRVKALLIIPQLTSADNVNVKATDSASFAGPVSPYTMRDYNVQVSTMDLYSRPLQYRYEHFQQELAGGKLGVDAGLSYGLSSGLISKTDHENTYGYIYSDLSRRHDYDDHTATSIAIRGTITSPLPLDLHCYMIFEKDAVINVASGERLV